jgi:hypothetical protein
VHCHTPRTGPWEYSLHHRSQNTPLSTMKAAPTSPIDGFVLRGEATSTEHAHRVEAVQPARIDGNGEGSWALVGSDDVFN